MKRNILICFIGIDGSGKSTLSRYLFEELKKRNYNVSYTWWLECENSLLRGLLRRVGGLEHSNSKNGVSNRLRAGKKSLVARLFGVLYPRIVLLDYLRFSIIKAWFPKIVGKNKVIIFDRFMYDVVLAISKEFDYSNSKRARLLGASSKLLPNPDLVFIVDTSPEVAYLRKKEEIGSIENAKASLAKYQELFSLLNTLTPGRIVKIDNTRELSIVKVEILKNTLNLLEGELDGK